MYTVIASANKDGSVSPLPICIQLISFSPLLALAKTSSTLLNRYGESGQPCVVPGFNGIALSFYPFKIESLLYITFIVLGCISCVLG